MSANLKSNTATRSRRPKEISITRRDSLLWRWTNGPKASRENFSIKLRGLTGVSMTFIKLEKLRSVYFVKRLVGRELIIEVEELLAQVLVVWGILGLEELACQRGIAC
jgi:hypothetical protein